MNCVLLTWTSNQPQVSLPNGHDHADCWFDGAAETKLNEILTPLMTPEIGVLPNYINKAISYYVCKCKQNLTFDSILCPKLCV